MVKSTGHWIPCLESNNNNNNNNFIRCSCQLIITWSYGAPLMRLQFAGASLLANIHSKINNVIAQLCLPFSLFFNFFHFHFCGFKVDCFHKTTAGQCCRIPFTYNGVTHYSCTTANHNRLWCSLDSTYKGNWGNCGKYLLL